jgi:bifunctional non-homologous end joining protein LigD
MVTAAVKAADTLLGMRCDPMRLLRIPQPFDHPDFFFEFKYDGFRALAIVENGVCRLVSRNGYIFSSWPDLAADVAKSVGREHAVLDGEIVTLDDHGRPDFYSLMFRRRDPVFVAFDLVHCHRGDLRSLRLATRKRMLQTTLRRSPTPRVRYAEHVRGSGIDLFKLACEHDLEGIVAKWMHGTYQDGPRTSWLKIKNPTYSQMEGRAEVFEKRGASEGRRKQHAPLELCLA